MSKEFFQNQYNPGDIVYAKANPHLKLVIRRYIDQIYYCKSQGEPDTKELVYYERELVEDPGLAAKNEIAREQNLNDSP